MKNKEIIYIYNPTEMYSVHCILHLTNFLQYASSIPKIPATMMFQWTSTLNVLYKFGFHIPHWPYNSKEFDISN